MEYEDCVKVVTILKKTQKYIQAVHDIAEADHDSVTSELYMDYGLYETIEETEKILSEIESL